MTDDDDDDQRNEDETNTKEMQLPFYESAATCIYARGRLIRHCDVFFARPQNEMGREVRFIFDFLLKITQNSRLQIQ